MKDIVTFLKEAKFSSYEQYLNSLKTKKTSYNEFKDFMSLEFYINVDEFDSKDNKIYASYNPHNNAEGKDVLLTIDIKGNEHSFNVVKYNEEEA